MGGPGGVRGLVWARHLPKSGRAGAEQGVKRGCNVWNWDALFTGYRVNQLGEAGAGGTT